MIMFRGALPLKTCAQICLCFECFIALTYAGIFTVLESIVWFPMMLLFLSEAGFSVICLLDVYEKTTLGMVSSRLLFTVLG